MIYCVNTNPSTLRRTCIYTINHRRIRDYMGIRHDSLALSFRGESIGWSSDCGRLRAKKSLQDTWC